MVVRKKGWLKENCNSSTWGAKELWAPPQLQSNALFSSIAQGRSQSCLETGVSAQVLLAPQTALIQLMTSICSKPNVFWEASSIRPGRERLALQAFAASLLCYSSWGGGWGYSCMNHLPPFQPHSPFPPQGLKGQNRSAPGFVLSLFGSEENWKMYREKKGFCVASLPKEVRTAFITSLPPL